MTPLRQRMIEDMQLRNLTPETQRNYVHHVANFARYFGVSPEVLDLEAVRDYQLYLLNERKLSPETINQYISSVKFLYRVTLEMPWTDEYFPRIRRALKLQIVLSQEEILAFFDQSPDETIWLRAAWADGDDRPAPEALHLHGAEPAGRFELVVIGVGHHAHRQAVDLGRCACEPLRRRGANVGKYAGRRAEAAGAPRGQQFAARGAAQAVAHARLLPRP